MSKSVDVNGFRWFLESQANQITIAYTEIEQLQAEFQGAYTRFRAEHDKTLYALAAQIEGGANGTGKSLSAQIEARANEEQPLIVQQIADLQSQLEQIQAKADEVLARSQQASTRRHEQNPKLNEREEELKANVAQQQQRLNELNTQIGQLSRGLGLIRHSVKILTLDRERWKIIGRLEQLEQELHKVRLDWKHLADDTIKEETDAKEQWQKKTLQLTQLRQQYDYLSQNTAGEARHRAIVYILDNLKTQPAGDEAATLQPMIDLNIETDDFQAALGSVSEILGTLTGMREGLKRFKASLNSLEAEQQQHSDYLSPLHFQIPDEAWAFGQTWDDLFAKTKDEKALATHPADFVTAMKSFMEERLSNDRITHFFNALGASLNAATRSWKSA